jgi:hypothetical protein
MTTESNVHHHQAAGLLDAIERESEALARLFETCGASRDFAPAERHQFQQLLRRRSQLITRLEELRHPGRPDRMASGE